VHVSDVLPENGNEPGGEQPVEETWQGPTQEEWEQAQAQLAQANELYQAVAYANQQSQQEAFDPYDPNQLRGLIRQELAPYSEFQQGAQEAENEERIRDMIHDDAVRNGEFDESMARLRASELVHEMVAKYGDTDKAAEMTIQAAATAQRDWEHANGQAAVERYKNELRGISTIPREPPAAGAPAAQQHVVPEGGDETDLVRRYFPTRA
jgi:hypothetical protein